VQRTRSAALPDIPAVGEFVPGYEGNGWSGVGSPKNTPAKIIDKLNREINAGLADPTMQARIADLGGSAMPMTPTDTSFKKNVNCCARTCWNVAY
jgi:tripartite-type tricarboxylate transporter receptor subunit TctC